VTLAFLRRFCDKIPLAPGKLGKGVPQDLWPRPVSPGSPIWPVAESQAAEEI